MKALAAVGVLIAGLKLAASGYPVLLLVAVAVAAVLWVGASGGSAKPSLARMERVAVRTPGGHGTRTAARHEAGHRRYAKARGWRVRSTQIFPDGSGVTIVDVPGSATAAEKVGLAVSGGFAAGTSQGCGSDHAYRDQVLARQPRSERGKARRAGESMARSAVGWLSGVGSDAAQLLKNGRING